jgi:GNAT superfamily N-acetyltransferase
MLGWYHMAHPNSPNKNAGIERALLTIELRYYTLTNQLRAKSSEHEAFFRPLLSNTFPEDKYPEGWNLSILSVDPAYQKRGIGKQLMRWGLERAVEENVSVGLESMPPGEKLYESCGLKMIREIEELKGRLPWEERIGIMYAEVGDIRIPKESAN